MKIVMLITNIKNCGPFSVIENIIENCNIKHDNIHIVSVCGNDDKQVISELEKKGYKTANLGIKKHSFFISNNRLQEYIKKNNIDVVHSHGIIPDYLNSKISVRKITTIHNNMFEDYPATYGNVKAFFLKKIHLSILEKFDKIICCSKCVFESLQDKVKNKNITFIRNGYKEQENNETDLDEQLPANKFIYLFAGRINKGKNVLNLIKMFQQFSTKDDLLLVLGDGPQKEECDNYISLNKIDNILMLGYKNNVSEYLNISDVYFSASSSEGFSISILEAISKQNYLLLSNIPSHVEAINLDKKIYLGEIFDNNNYVLQNIKLRKRIKKEKKEKLKSIDISATTMAMKYYDNYKE